MNAHPDDTRTSGRVFRSDTPLAAAPGLLRVGTRGSALAVAQTTTVAETIAAATGLDVGLVIVTTHGDTSRAPLSQLGGTGVFVSALRDALLTGECDLAVHSLKDLPTGPCPGIALGAVPERADARDALCARDGLTLQELPTGARVGTGSPRRVAQLLRRRPDLDVVDLRGNVDTRLGRVESDLDAVVLACAGLDRLGRSSVITERFPLDEMPAAPGQGALAIEVRADDLAREPYAEALSALDHAESRACALAERAVLATLEAGCAAPIGATARVVDGALELKAEVSALDGTQGLSTGGALPWTAADPEHRQIPDRLGRTVAESLFEMGAAMIAPLGGTEPGAERPGGTRPGGPR
ncbi:hydroxymethylbilane synthase [Leucobacter tenebrionis]|uniref:hydroxymethylbilane synthase n=1 Tax=Leucobacter tenebrionis TaxID=2873270 RepID=UPI001CA6F027|nr:hydroxymethylbilane synthase [Leucobacter tenebrionis]QZY53025.1 hydroxymethylbilane synthase [Leucobacter tenebrionis]